MSNPADTEATNDWASIHRDLPSDHEDFDPADWYEPDLTAAERRQQHEDEMADLDRKARLEERI